MHCNMCWEAQQQVALPAMTCVCEDISGGCNQHSHVHTVCWRAGQERESLGMELQMAVTKLWQDWGW